MQFPHNITLHERYLLRSVLGVGGQAYVFRALDQQLMVERAVKVLSPKSFRIAEARTRFQSEAQILAGIEHPNIVRVYDIVHAQTYLFIVMEVLSPATMSDVVRQLGPIPESSVGSILLPITQAVQAAHEDGIIHRDLKPSNILLSSEGVPKLSDFGIAQLNRPDELGLTQTGIAMGTQGYMSPEQRTSAKSVDSRADVYSLGATLYRLLTGLRPVDLFTKDPSDDCFAAVSPAMVDVILRATRYDAGQRYDSASQFGDALFAATQQSATAESSVAYEWSQPLQPKRSEAALLNNPGVQDFLQSISTWDDVFAAGDVSEVSDTGVTIDLQQPLTTAAPEPQPTLVPPGAMGSGRRRAVGLIFGGVLAASVATGVFWGWSNPQKVSETHAPSNAERLEVCHALAGTLQSQQQADGGFSGIPQNPTALWDTAQQLVSLQYSRRCGVEIIDAERRANEFLMRWLQETKDEELLGFGLAWMLLSLKEDASGVEDTLRNILRRYRLQDGSYAVTLRDAQANKSDLYMTTLSAWALIVRSEPLDDALKETLGFLIEQLRTPAVQEISGLEEQIWWTIHLAVQRDPSIPLTVSDNQRLASNMIRRCQVDEDNATCRVPIWPSGTFNYTRSNGVTANVLAQGHPWSVIASGVLADASGLDPEQRDALRVIHHWGQIRLTQSPDTLILSPGYVLSESLIAVAMGLSPVQ